MTLRELGTSLGSIWDLIVADLDALVSNSPLDWPLWIFPTGVVLVFFLLPKFARAILREVRTYISNGVPMGIVWCVAFTVATVFCAVFSIDLYVTKAVFDETDPAPSFLFICYPFFTLVLAFFAFMEWRKYLRALRRRG